MNKFFTLSILIILFCSTAFSAGLTYDEQVYDFGHVGIDFKLFHSFKYVNKTDAPVKIKDIVITCDCTEVNYADSIVSPGDTLDLNLIFSTKDYYGPTTKNFIVKTDDPTMPEFTYFYSSIVGQWYDGLKPEPISLFFLPGVKSKTVKVKNIFFDNIRLGKIEQYDDSFTYKVIESEADKGDDVAIEVSPSKDLSTGTHFSVLTFELVTDKDKSSKISIPVKIVRY